MLAVSLLTCVRGKHFSEVGGGHTGRRNYAPRPAKDFEITRGGHCGSSEPQADTPEGLQNRPRITRRNPRRFSKLRAVAAKGLQNHVRMLLMVFRITRHIPTTVFEITRGRKRGSSEPRAGTPDGLENYALCPRRSSELVAVAPEDL